MKHCPWHTMLLLSLVILAVIADSDSSSSHEVELVESLVDWLRGRNGIFNEKLEIRSTDPEDSSSGLGIFATRFIGKGELLIAVPSDSIIVGEFEVEEEGSLGCDTVRSLIHEMRLGDESEFAPYMRYLLAQSPGQLPSVWSEAGKDLLHDVFHSGSHMLPPGDVLDWMEEWRDSCDGNHDPFEENAAMLVVKHSRDNYMIPMWDVLRHRNGHWLNAEGRDTHEDTRFDIGASRDIEEGEEIYVSHNFCPRCEDRALSYGTPQILRDYGFVEEMPQRWIFEDINVAFDLHGSGSDPELSWLGGDKEISDSAIEILNGQLWRLKVLTQTDFEHDNGVVPKHEWDIIWQYHQGLILAITHAIKAAIGTDGNLCSEGKGTCAIVDMYDAFNDEEDDLDYDTETCHNSEALEFNDYEDIAEVTSAYQTMHFMEHPENKDMCFDLDNTLQICSSYRPHYHESVVHFSARYLDSVRRVVFVGGGDSMILHEVLKYPSLELVIGLELDQKVTRHSFKHFNTQPHFDDERVEWWFGDATKSLLMLPKEFFGSFDLVLVDLSETVMSFPVTEELDVLEALALLLKPDGIFVKNEEYLDKISEIFDHAIQLYWGDNPLVCEYTLNMGSNGVDFFHHTPKDHNLENLWIGPLDDMKDHFSLIHDYRRNITSVQGHCKEPDRPKDEYIPQVKSAGILMIVEAEDITIPLENAEIILFAALQKEGLTPLSTVSSSSNDKRGALVIIMREGYVVARSWPEHKYCAFDIHLWGGFENLENVRDAFITAVGSSRGPSSSYRIVVGGMFGASTWKYDQENLGPRVTQTCDREARVGGVDTIDQSEQNIVLEESMDLVQNNEAVVVVLCGEKNQSCSSLDLLIEHDNVQEVIAISCPDMKGGDQFMGDGAARMLACEKDTLNTLRKSVAQKQKISAFIVDPTAPIAIAQIVHKILRMRRNKKELLMPNVIFMAMMPDETEKWRGNFIEKCRRNIIYDPLYRADILFNSPKSSMEMSVTSSGNPNFFIHLLEVTNSIKNRSGLDADIREIQGSVLKFQDELDPKIFLAGDYDQLPGQEQYSAQRPFGHQTVFQLEVGKGKSDNANVLMSAAQVKDALDGTLSRMGFAITELKVFTEIGDGCLLVVIFSEGSAIVVWDGNVHVDINLFTYTESVYTATLFVDRFMAQISNMEVSLRDEQPRGIGRVINFIEDMYPTSDTV